MSESRPELNRFSSPQQPVSMAPGTEPRRSQNKSVRVTFGPDTDIYIPPSREEPTNSYPHRSRTDIDGNHTNGASSTDSDPSADPSSKSARPTPTLVRAKSEHWPHYGTENGAAHNDDDDDDFQLRHGWHDEYTSPECLDKLSSVRTTTHLEGINN